MISERKILVLVVLAMGALSSCKKPTVGDFAIESTISFAYALPTAIKSCTDDFNLSSTASLAEASASFNKLKYTWRGSNRLDIQYIQVSLKGGSFKNGRYDKTIAGDELTHIFGSQPSAISGASSPSTAVTYTTDCGIRIGGIGFNDVSKPGSGVGTIIVVALETDGDGQSYPVSAETQVAIQYDGKPGT